MLLVALVRYLVDGPQRQVAGRRTMREILGIDVLPGVGEWGRRISGGRTVREILGIDVLPGVGEWGPEEAARAADHPVEDQPIEDEQIEDDVAPVVEPARPVAALVEDRDEVTVRLSDAAAPAPPPTPEPAPSRTPSRSWPSLR